MRKSILSAYLMGAIALATTSTFVSCKDYDDDITNLQEQIDANSSALKATKDALEAEITNLKSQLDATKTELTGLISKAQAAADAAQAAADKAQAAADKAQSSADKAQASADAAQAAADKAQATADQNAKDLADEAARAKAAEQANADAINAEVLRATAKEAALEARIEAAEKALADLKALVDTKVDQKEFDQAVKDIYAAIAAVDAKVAANLEKIEALQKGLEDEITARKALAKDLEEQKAALAKLDTRLTTLEGTVKGIQDEIAIMKANIAQAQKDIEALQKAVADNAKAIEDIKAEIEKLDARLIKAQTTADTALQAANKALEAAAANKKAIEDEAARAKAAEKEAKEAAAAAQKTADQAVKDAAAAKAAADKAQAAADKAQATADKNAKDLAAEAARAKAAEEKAQAAAEAAQKAADAAQKAADAAQKTADQAVKDAAEAKAYAEKVESELTARLEEAEAAIEAAQQAADDAQAAADAAQESADAAQEAADAAQATADQALAEIDVLTVYVHHALRSLVLDVEEYWWGVEAVNIKAYAYKNVKVDAADVTKDQVEDHQVWGESNRTGDNAYFNATYFLNPSGANVTENAADYSFVNVKDVNYTRAAACGELKVVSVKKNAGKIDVQGSVESPELLKDINTQSMVTIFALQYDAVDSVITSDWAALRRSWVTNFRVNKVSVEGAVETEKSHNHAYKTAAEAVEADPVFELVYNDANGIDLNKWFNVHANLGNNPDELWGGQETLNKAGFELQYELIGYDLESEYNESQFAVIEGSVLKAKDPKNAEPQVHMIGHTPLVRIKLVNKNDKTADAIALGYFKVVIIGETNNVDVDLNVNVNLNCGDEVVIDKDVALTSELVKEKLMSVEMFERDFHLEINENMGTAIQYTADHKTTCEWGQVTSNEASPYLHLTVNNGEAYEAFSKAATKTIIVKYTDGASRNIYVTINVINDKKLEVPSLAIVDADKTDTPWYAHNSTNKGFDEVHAHVNEGTLGASMWVFGLDKALWKKDGVTSSLYDVLTAKQEANSALKNLEDMTLTYYFVEPTVKEVKCATLRDNNNQPIVAKLSVSEDGTKLYAQSSVFQKTVIAELDPATGEIEYMQNDPAGEVLNWAAHNELADGETLTARVGVKAAVCEPIGDLDIDGNEFDVKFLRPISFNNEHAEVIDAIPAVYDVEVLLNFWDWRDWTPEQFSAGTNGLDFAEFYELKSIKMNEKAPVMTDFAENGKFVAMNDALEDYFEFSMDEVAPITLDENYQAHVTVKYIKHAGEVVSQFQAKIPVILEYAWGKLSSEIIVTVKPTEANGVRARK